MQRIDFKQLIPYISAITVFFFIAVIYFQPALQGKVLQQNDIVQGVSSQQEIIEHKEKTGEESLWTNSMFSGMPAFQIRLKTFSGYLTKIRQMMELWLPRPAAIYMLLSVGFFILMLSFGINPWLSIIGAIAFAFSSYHFVILEAGHIWKIRAISFMAPSLAGFVLLYRKKYWLGLIVLSLFLTFQIHSNHIQMTYYMFLLIGLFALYFIWESVQNKASQHIYKAAGLSLLAIMIALGVNATNLYTTYEYGKYSQRGDSELAAQTGENATGGLERDYITQWSYGIGESFSILIPNVKGGGSGYIGNNETALENVDARFRDQISQSSKYWGNQPFMGGPDFYFGAFVVFLFVLGMFFSKNRLKWVFFAGFVMSVMLSWGLNFPMLTNFFIDHFPLYNKFRVVASILVVAGLCVPIIAFLGLNEFIKNPGIIFKEKKKFYYTLGLTGGLLLIFYLMPNTFFSFLSDREADYFNTLQARNPQQAAMIDQYIQNLEAARIAIFKADAMRSLLFILAGTVVLWLYTNKKINQRIFLFAVAGVIVIDMWSVNTRYLNHDHFERKRNNVSMVEKSRADEIILQDTSHYRVLNLTVSPFQDATTSYYHKSIGGYHGAKLMKYKELIDYQLGSEINRLQQALQSENATRQTIDTMLRATETLNMLQTKYLIVHKNAAPVQNPFANPPAWFVRDVQLVETALEEITGLDDIDISKTAIVRKKYASQLNEVNFPQQDSLARISLTEYNPNRLVYTSESNSPQLAVFSEVYYPKGWQAYIDGEEAEHFVVNHLLRAMVIPEGKHTIEFEFRPKSYYVGETMSKVSSAILLLVLLSFVSIRFIKK